MTAVAAFVIQASSLQASDLPDFTELAAENSPTVVNIKAIPKKQEIAADNPQGMPFSRPFGPDGGLPDFFRYFYDELPGQRKKPRRDARPSQGSGFIMSPDGYIITNHHVVDGAGELIVTLSDRSELTAELIGSDERSDIAVLKIDAAYELQTVNLGDSDSLKVGEWVLAIGSPFGFDYSVTAGIVSAKSRSLPDDNYVPFIQTDVAINPGNSGGPLFNLQGKVVGVNSQIYSRTGGFMGLSFAIPMKVVLNVYKQIKQTGSVSRGWLGVFIQDVTQELAESFGMTIELGEAVYYSRSRKQIWHKGKTSGLVQTIREIRIDDDQDCVWLKVDVEGGASCHVGYRSCFYRSIPFGKNLDNLKKVELKFEEKEKVFDPQKVYGDSPNPTRL